MAACTAASWALVRASTAMRTSAARGYGTASARSAAQAASSASLAWAITAGTGPSTRLLRAASISPRTVSSDSLSRSTAVATATTWGVQRWFSSSRMTLVPPQDLGQSIEQRRIGAVEAVDGLVGVAHHEEVGLVGEEGRQQAELGRVDVLHLVDEEVAGPPADGVGEGGVAGQRIGAGDDQIVEVEQPAPGPLGLVAGEDVGHLPGADAAPSFGPAGLGLVVPGRDQAGLGPPDLAVERAAPGGGRPVATSARSRRRSGSSWGSGRPRWARCSRRSPRAVRWKVPAWTPETPRDHRRVRSSSAALRLKVVTRPRSASMEPSRTRRATRRVSTLVLPAPAPAITQSRGSSASMADRWAKVRRLRSGQLLPGVTFERDRHGLTVPNGCSPGSRPWSLR